MSTRSDVQKAEDIVMNMVEQDAPCSNVQPRVRTLLHPRMPHLARLKGFVQYAELEDVARDVPIHLRLLDHGNQRDLFNSD